MRSFPFLFLIIFFLTACGARVANPEPSPVASGVSEIQIGVAGADFVVGQSRLPLILFAGAQRGAGAQRVALTAFDLSTTTPTGGWSGEAVNYDDYLIPYWVAYPELPQSGLWGFEVAITLPDDRITNAQFTIQVNEKSTTPPLGETPPASENRTLKTEPDISKLSSDFADPELGLYQMTVAEAIASGRPTVISFATPAFCTSQLCAPVLDSVKAVYQDLGNQANFIHIEVFKTFDPLVLADEMREWDLETEPWTFLLDSEGRLTGKFGGPLGPKELTEALVPLLP